MAKKKKGKTKRYCPGNFRLPSPAAAKRFITKWEKLGAPAVGVDGLKTEKDVKIAKIRLKQAELIQKAFDKRVEKYTENRKVWADCKAAGTALKDCTGLDQGKLLPKPDADSHANTGCAGNFRVPSKKNSKNYLKRFFKQFRTDVSMNEFVPDATGAFSMQGKFAKFGSRGAPTNFVQKLQVAIEVVGVEEAGKIAQAELKKSIEKANTKLTEIAAKLNKPSASLTKAQENLKKKVESAQKRLATKTANLEADRAKLNKYLGLVSPAPTVSAATGDATSVACPEKNCKARKGAQCKNKKDGESHAKRVRAAQAVAKPRRYLRRRSR